MELADWLTSAAQEAPARAAVRTAHATVPYADLARRADMAAGRLAARGVARGDRVGIALAPGVAFVETLHACWRLGAIAVPVDPRLSLDEVAQRTAGATTLVTEPLEGRAVAVALLDAHQSDDVAVVMHTSGTTAAPKPVSLTYGNFAASARGSAAVLGSDPEERWLCALPLAHVGGLSILVRSAIGRSTAVVHERFDVRAVTTALREDGVTMVSLVATMLGRLLAGGLRHPPQLRCALIGGGPLRAELIDRAEAAGIPLAQTYGLTEACSQVTTSAIGEPETAGRPLPGTSLQIASDGEVLVAGPTVAPTALAADGLLHTGDLGRLDAAGRLTVTGRRSEVIITGGENVAPAEVEAALASHPAVADAAVYGRPDEHWGEAVNASVVLRTGATATPVELRDHCRAVLAAFKVPKELRVVDALPRTESGKLLRRGLA
jgi:O-succinylbenzoic acid--CoA ligase